MDILNILDKVYGISSFILGIYILLKEKKKKISVLNAKVPADQAEDLSEENASNPLGNSTNWLGFSKNIIISHINMSKTSLILNTICLFLTIRFFIVTDFSNLQMLDTIYLIVIVLWILAVTISVFMNFKK
ncbi:hypothetical protein ACQGSX_19310 [Bacillus sp. GMs2/1]|uniref:hypothetical protein n=1 Tax=Bacillus sp. GMs2/1 TaxID=3418493 RepID=UPI003CF6D2B9